MLSQIRQGAPGLAGDLLAELLADLCLERLSNLRIRLLHSITHLKNQIRRRFSFPLASACVLHSYSETAKNCGRKYCAAKNKCQAENHSGESSV